MVITIYTDGACSNNPGVGGWGVVILKNNETICLNGGRKDTTNNQMELIANINALKYFKSSTKIVIYTDSKYVKDGIETWIITWKKNGWKTSFKKQVKNKDLWIELDKQISRHTISWKWVKGHSGNKYNEHADYLARKYIENNK